MYNCTYTHKQKDKRHTHTTTVQTLYCHACCCPWAFLGAAKHLGIILLHIFSACASFWIIYFFIFFQFSVECLYFNFFMATKIWRTKQLNFGFWEASLYFLGRHIWNFQRSMCLMYFYHTELCVTIPHKHIYWRLYLYD